MIIHKQKGFTLVEVLVAMLILAIGSSTVWYIYESLVRLNLQGQKHWEASILAQEELEYVRILPKEMVHDTVYEKSGVYGGKYKIKRTVFDSVKIEESMDDIDVDENGRPLHLRRPLEIKVQIREKKEEEALELEKSEISALFTLSFLKPDYNWYD